MLFLIDPIENEGGAYGSAPEDSRKGATNEPADDEGTSGIEDVSEAFAGSEESDVEQENG